MSVKKKAPSTVFYRCTGVTKTTSQTKQFIIQTPDYELGKIKEILLEVHPEYKDITFEEIEKPDHVKAWGD